MSKHWTPPRHTAKLRRPSRIRREPVKLTGADPRQERKLEVITLERQLWTGIAGIAAIAVALVVLAIGISIATFSRYDPAAAAAEAAHFGQCYNAYGPNCVLDGETLYFAGEKIQIAGVETPAIHDAACAEEKNTGINAALRLADLLNNGSVAVSGAFRDRYGRDVRTVEVNGMDVGQSMIGEGLARRYDGEKQNWC